MKYIDSTDLTWMVHSDDVIICRTLAPLVNWTIQLQYAGHEAYLKGGKSAAAQVKLVAQSVVKLFGVITKENIESKWNLLEVSLDLGDKTAMRDKYDILQLIVDTGCKDIPSIDEELLLIFKDEPSTPHVTLCLEAEAPRLKGLNVFILPSPLGMPELGRDGVWEVRDGSA
jgi:hypothetical protein